MVLVPCLDLLRILRFIFGRLNLSNRWSPVSGSLLLHLQAAFVAAALQNTQHVRCAHRSNVTILERNFKQVFTQLLGHPARVPSI
jgi:hypothetical protein